MKQTENNNYWGTIFLQFLAIIISVLLHNDKQFYMSFRYLVKNSSTLFSASDYEVAPPEYHRKAVWKLSAHSTAIEARHHPLPEHM